MNNVKFKLLLFVAFLFVNFNVNSAEKNSNDSTVTFFVSMDCLNCKQKIERNIAFEKGVKALNVDLNNKIVRITFNKNKNNVEKLKQAIVKLGYQVALTDSISN
ncbi:MAG: heavy metal-associated domain-containing protein [Paludibacter sp.]